MMTVFADGHIPDPKRRAEIISQADTDTLNKLQDAAWAAMHSLSQPGKTASPEYREWSNFVGEIRAELRKRAF